jgi:hypothetical protein
VKHFNTCEPCSQDILKYEVDLHSCLHLDQLRPVTGIEIESSFSDCGLVFRCPDCNMIFDSGEQLASHKIAHKDSYPYACDVCSDNFRTSWGLKKHRKVHVVESSLMRIRMEKGFKCNVCGEAYHFRRYLLLHKSQYHMKGRRKGLQVTSA